MKVVFLEPEGVLLSARAAVMPANAALRFAKPWRLGYVEAESAIQAAFDPAAVALVNRLCRISGASLVVQSRWLSLGPDAVRAKLIAEGIDGRHLGDAWACEYLRLGDGRSMRNKWIREHGRSPFQRAILDTVRYDPGTPAVDPVDGLSVEDYRLACGMLVAEDLDYGVSHVCDADLERVDQAFGSCSMANAWLHGPDWRRQSTNAALLGHTVQSAIFGLIPLSEAERDRRREIVWARLAAEAPPIEEEQEEPPQDPAELDF